MNSLNGFIKLFRKFKAWGWYQDYVVKDVFIHLLLSANFSQTKWNDRVLNEGQVVIGTTSLAAELGFSRQQIRTALTKLKSTNEITTESTNKYTIVTIVNWRDYQSESETATNKLTNRLTFNQPTNNQQITNNQPQIKNKKNKKNKKNGKKREGTLTAHGTFENVFLTDSEFNDLQARYPNHYQAKIDRLSRYIENNPDRNYSNHYAVLIDWLIEDVGDRESVSIDNGCGYDINELNKINTLDFIE